LPPSSPLPSPSPPRHRRRRRHRRHRRRRLRRHRHCRSRRRHRLRPHNSSYGWQRGAGVSVANGDSAAMAVMMAAAALELVGHLWWAIVGGPWWQCRRQSMAERVWQCCDDVGRRPPSLVLRRSHRRHCHCRCSHRVSVYIAALLQLPAEAIVHSCLH